MEKINPIEAIYVKAKRNRITLGALAKKAKSDPSTFRRWMAGSSSPRLSDIERYDAALDQLIMEKSE